MPGGSMAHNAMIYSRGNPTDYINWAALGNEGWGWEEVKPYFLKSEDNREIGRVGRFWHATGGPLPVETFQYLPPFGHSIMTAGAQTGYGTTEDLNGAKLSGRISLASRNPLEHPVIWFNHLSNSKDVERLVEAVELGLAMGKTKAFRAYNFTLSTVVLEQCSHHKYPSRAYWTCAKHQGQASEGHVGGSCKMRPASDGMAVVDPRLQVHGMRGLGVVDASIMPQPLSATSATPTVMIAERAANFIQEKWNRG